MSVQDFYPPSTSVLGLALLLLSDLFGRLNHTHT